MGQKRNKEVEWTTGSNEKKDTVDLKMEKEEAKEKKGDFKSRLTFQINEVPPLHISLFYGFQIIFCSLPLTVAAVFIIHSNTCGGRDYEYLARLMSSVIFMCGLASLIQVLIGSRLPIAQGSSFVFLSPIVAMNNSPAFKCKGVAAPVINATIAGLYDNQTMVGVVDTEPEWVSRVGIISGALICASCVQVLFGLTGLMGFLMRFIGPLTLAPTVMLIGLTYMPFAVDSSAHQWWISILTIGLLVIFSTICAEILIPIPTWNRTRGFHIRRYPLLRMFSNLLAIAIAWLLCYILTVTNRLTDNPDEVGYLTRTDAKLDAISKMSWFYFPYPGHFGPIRFSADIFIGMVASTVSSTLESVGDYYATARIVELTKPPLHTINRAVAMEGVGSIICGLVGACHGTTSYSNVIGYIAYTGVASRICWVIMAIMLMVFGVFGKLAGALASVPEPIVGGITGLGLSLVVLVGMSQLHSVNLMAIRNQITLAVAIGMGMQFPDWLGRYPGAIKTGSDIADTTLYVFLTTGPFVGGMLGLALDNILPGTREERGMLPDDNGDCGEHLTLEQRKRVYDFPLPTLWLAKYKLCTYLPFMPCYQPRNSACAKRCCPHEDESEDESEPISDPPVYNGHQVLVVTDEGSSHRLSPGTRDGDTEVAARVTTF